jgi:serine/threonine protein kinase
MEFADSGNLQDVIEKYKKTSKKENISEIVPESEILEYFAQLVDAIAYIHHRNIIHRDLKPENVLLMKNVTVKIADFGFARIIEKNWLSITVKGTPCYAFPEKFLGLKSGFSVDFWSLGSIRYKIMNGHVVSPCETNEELKYHLENTDVKAIECNYSDHLKDFVIKCW